ncbi:hypothetical protein [Actinoplanes sp. GCM10030250]|uniref:hypothetical protein n=1 Tax=Actinoplanes sp. GCM10030250 TaxID=3273376 RepID=UPI0036120452
MVRESTPARRSIPARGLFAAVLVVLAVLVVASPASASVSKHHGKWASQVAGCQSNFRIGKTARLIAGNGADYGWVEWRASRTGACAGYQWVRLHFTRNLGFTSNEPHYKSWQMQYKNRPWVRGAESRHQYNLKVRGLRYFKAGDYNSRIFYAPSEKACATLETYANRRAVSLRINGQGQLPKLKYCA